MEPTYIQVLIKKTMLEARINRIFFCLQVEGLIFILMHCMFRYSYSKIFWGPWNFSENQQKRWWWLATFFKNAGGESVKELQLLLAKNALIPLKLHYPKSIAALTSSTYSCTHRVKNDGDTKIEEDSGTVFPSIMIQSHLSIWNTHTLMLLMHQTATDLRDCHECVCVCVCVCVSNLRSWCWCYTEAGWIKWPFSLLSEREKLMFTT